MAVRTPVPPRARGARANQRSNSGLLLVLLVLVIIVAAFFLYRRSTATTAAPPTPTAIPATPIPARVAARLAYQGYAAQITPALDRATRLFSRKNAAIQNHTGSALSTACSSLVTQGYYLQQTFEGIPHPYPWYSPIGHLHHRVSGVFHKALGAAQQCVTAISAGDVSSRLLAQQDVAVATAQMHALDRRAHTIARH